MFQHLLGWFWEGNDGHSRGTILLSLWTVLTLSSGRCQSLSVIHRKFVKNWGWSEDKANVIVILVASLFKGSVLYLRDVYFWDEYSVSITSLSLSLSLLSSHIGSFVDWLCSHCYVWEGSLHSLDHPSLCPRTQANWWVIKLIKPCTKFIVHLIVSLYNCL